MTHRPTYPVTAEPIGPPTAQPLRNRTALVTGGGRGLGRLLATALADAGACVAVVGRTPRPLRDTAEELESRGVRALALTADLTAPETVRRAVEQVIGEFGALDILVNNAGVGGPVGPFWSTGEPDWRRALDVNLHGTAGACRAALPHMTARRSGRVINIVSVAGHNRWPYASAYSVSKAAIIKLTENLAHELAGHGVRTFSFHPGLLDLGLTRDHLERGETGDPWRDRIGDWLRAERDAGRFTPPERVGRALIHLADGTADPLTGRYLTAEDDIPALARTRTA